MATPIFLTLMVGLVLVAVAAAAVVGFIVLVAVLRRPAPRVYGPAVRPVFSTPLERAQAAASALTAEEWEAFRRWVDGSRPTPVPAGNGVAR
jgi:hypothetical protein